MTARAPAKRVRKPAVTVAQGAPDVAVVVDPVTEYSTAVVEGRTLAGELVIAACRRHLRDLTEGKYRWDPALAAHVCEFFELLTHSKGEWAGTRLHLEPWQVFLVGSIFGWFRADGTRRFRTAYAELPRKSGKSVLGAAVGLYLAFFDDEPGAEVYAAATMRDQARIVWDEAHRMVSSSAFLKRKIEPRVLSLMDHKTNSVFRPLSSDENTLDGLNIHGVVIDELHAHKNRQLWDRLRTASGARRQPLAFVITTAGEYDPQSIGWEQHRRAEQVVTGALEDDSLFAFVANVPKDADWRKEQTWRIANPNYGVSVKPDFLRQMAAEAEASGAALTSFMRFHLDIWAQASVKWITAELWAACGGAFDEAAFEGRACYGGLDLSSTQDTTSLALVFPGDAGEVHVVWRYWVPEDTLLKRSRRDNVPYDAWAREGWLIPTPGNVVDYDYVRAEILALAKRYDIREIAFDSWNATQITTQLAGDGIVMVQYGQGYASMSAPTKELERLIRSRLLKHGDNPISTWQMSNAAVEIDAAGNTKPSKDKAPDRIDGVVALVMGLGRSSVAVPVGPSVYDEREPVVIG